MHFTSIRESDLRGRRILMYSYGSGLASAMFSLFVHPTRNLSDLLGSASEFAKCDLNTNSILNRLFNERTRVDISKFETILKERFDLHNRSNLFLFTIDFDVLLKIIR